MSDQPLLAGFGQIMGQQQDSGRAQAFRLLRTAYRRAGWATSAGDDGYLVLTRVDCNSNDVRVLFWLKREKFTRSTGRKQGTGAIGCEPLQSPGVGVGAKIQVVIKIRDGKRQQAG